MRGHGFGNSIGVYGWGESEPGAVGRSVNGNGMEGCADATDKGGVHGETSSPYGGHGVYDIATNTSASSYSNGVYGLTYSPNGAGGRFYNNRGGLALWASGAGNGAEKAAFRVHNNSNTYGMAACLTNVSGYHTAHFKNSGTGGVLFLQNNGGAE